MSNEAESRNVFFRGMSLFALIYIVFGFAPSFLLRPLFQPLIHGPTPPWYYYLHGVLMLAWLGLFVVQTSLVAAQRTDLHRRLGVCGVGLAIAVVVSMAAVTLALPHQYRVDRVRQLQAPFRGVVRLVWLNFAEIPLFAIYTAVAIWMRRHPQIHRRLLLLTLAGLMGPAAGRLANYQVVLPHAGAALGIMVVVGAVIVPVCLVVHDLLTMRRLHSATLWGVAGILVFGTALPLALAGLNVGRALVTALE